LYNLRDYFLDIYQNKKNSLKLKVTYFGYLMDKRILNKCLFLGYVILISFFIFCPTGRYPLF